ncbi:MAG TPA: DinB family protein [Vicinamibacterales bacterium]|nr:DinB family protein [Vicinamibacterales bacterium]
MTDDRALPAWARQIIDELHASDRHAGDVARGLTVAELNWRASPATWSVGQCLQHLLQANAVYLPPIAAALDRRLESPVAAITPGWFGRWFIAAYIEPSSPKRRRGRAPRKIAPAAEVAADVLDRFLASNETARELVRRASRHDVNRVRFVNPFVPVIRFTVGTGLEIIWRHQRRHLQQADAIRAELPSRSDGSRATLP